VRTNAPLELTFSNEPATGGEAPHDSSTLTLTATRSPHRCSMAISHRNVV